MAATALSELWQAEYCFRIEVGSALVPLYQIVAALSAALPLAIGPDSNQSPCRGPSGILLSTLRQWRRIRDR